MQGHARRHRVPPALEQETIGNSLPHDVAEIGARNRAAGAGADTTRAERDRESRTSVSLLQARRDQADHAGMPSFRRGHDHRHVIVFAERSLRFGFRLQHAIAFDRLALHIETVELFGDAAGFRRVFFQQQFHAEIGLADPAACIDARPEQEREVPGFRWA